MKILKTVGLAVAIPCTLAVAGLGVAYAVPKTRDKVSDFVANTFSPDHKQTEKDLKATSILLQAALLDYDNKNAELIAKTDEFDKFQNTTLAIKESYIDQIKVLNNILAEKTAELATATTDKETLEQSIRVLETTIETKENAIIELNAQLSAAQTAHAAEIATLQSQIADLTETIANFDGVSLTRYADFDYLSYSSFGMTFQLEDWSNYSREIFWLDYYSGPNSIRDFMLNESITKTYNESFYFANFDGGIFTPGADDPEEIYFYEAWEIVLPDEYFDSSVVYFHKAILVENNVEFNFYLNGVATSKENFTSCSNILVVADSRASETLYVYGFTEDYEYTPSINETGPLSGVDDTNIDVE